MPSSNESLSPFSTVEITFSSLRSRVAISNGLFTGDTGISFLIEQAVIHGGASNVGYIELNIRHGKLQYLPWKILDALLLQHMAEQVQEAVGRIENDLYARGKAEVESQVIGQMVMDQLRDLDDVAYVRFASVYRRFKDVNGLVEEIKEFKKWKQRTTPEEPKGTGQ